MNRMLWCKKRGLSLLLALVLFCLLGVRVIPAVQYNQNQCREFRQIREDAMIHPRRNPAYLPYGEGAPMETMDFSLAENMSYLYYYRDEHIYTMTLQKDVRYYTQPGGGGEPALILRAGTCLQLWGMPMFIERGWGSAPTYLRGWRFTWPFAVENKQGPDVTKSWDNQENSAITVESTRLYVRLEDLQEVYRSFRQEYPYVVLSPDEEINRNPTLAADRMLKKTGIYLSPDLLKPVWDGWDTLLAVIGFGCLGYGGWSLWRIRRNPARDVSLRNCAHPPGDVR